MKTRFAALVLGLSFLTGCAGVERIYPIVYDSLRSQQDVVDQSTARGTRIVESPSYREYASERERSMGASTR